MVLIDRSRAGFLFTLLFALGACGGEESAPPPVPPPPVPPPPDPPPPPGGLAQKITEAKTEILADTCFRQSGANCLWREQAYDPAEFAMADNSGEAILIVDTFPTLPLQAIRFRKRISGYYSLGAGGALLSSTSRWRIPQSLWNALDRFSGPEHVASQQLRELAPAIDTAYPNVQFDGSGHGSYVFSLLADTNPRQPIVILDNVVLPVLARQDYCDVSGASDVQARLTQVADHAAGELVNMMRTHNVRYVNYSAGHSFSVVKADWAKDCGGSVPPDAVLRQKLAAYAPIYSALFDTPGVLAAHAAIDVPNAADAPYDQASPAYGNRLRIGYFTHLASGLKTDGTGNYQSHTGWPSNVNADVYLNTGVLPDRPYPYNSTPLLQTDTFGLNLYPITRATTSWVAPLALSRFIQLRYSVFPDRPFDDALITDIFAAAVPARCPGLPSNRCVFQDPLLYGQVEATRLGYRPLFYP